MAIFEKFLMATVADQEIPPIASFFVGGEEEAPFLTTLSTGDFALAEPRQDGAIGHAFIECPEEEEGGLLVELYQALWEYSERFRWRTRFRKLESAISHLEISGFAPKYLIASDPPEEDLDLFLPRLTLVQTDALPPGAAIVSSLPSLAGYCTRVKDHLGASLFRVDRAIALVGL